MAQIPYAFEQPDETDSLDPELRPHVEGALGIVDVTPPDSGPERLHDYR